jgi:outer membrane protein OmpA-like peptidoglycan-associated protein
VDAVYKNLVGMLKGQTITRDFKGKANPVAVNDSPTKGMAQNRRVEIGIEK